MGRRATRLGLRRRDPGGGGVTVSDAVEKLGLKLESRKASVEQLVVDSAEKTPTEN